MIFRLGLSVLIFPSRHSRENELQQLPSFALTLPIGYLCRCRESTTLSWKKKSQEYRQTSNVLTVFLEMLFSPDGRVKSKDTNNLERGYVQCQYK